MHQELPDLFEASRALENETRVASLAAAGLAAACPRGMVLVYTLRGRPARRLGAVRATEGGGGLQDLVLSDFRQVFEWAPTFYDRAHVDVLQRNRWVDLPPDWFRETEYGRVFRPYATMGRFLLCEGSRPIACLGVLLREGQTPFSPDERRRLEKAATRAARPVRISALLSEANAYQDAAEHLMASRTDVALLLDSGGRLLAASAAGIAALESRPTLRAKLAEAARGSRGRAVTLTDPETALQIRLTPCSPRGGAAALLAVVGDVPSGGRARLTSRQAELLGLLAQGLTNASIAARMDIRPSTVKTMLEVLYRRAGVSGRVGLLRWAGRGLADVEGRGRREQ